MKSKLFLFSLCFVTSHVACADEDLSVYLGGAEVLYGSEFKVKNDPTAGLSVQYNLNEKNSVEAGFNWLHTHWDTNSRKSDNGSLYRLGYLHYLTEKRDVRPVVMLGVGMMHLDTEKEATDTFNVNAGFGIEYALSEKVSFRASARDYFSVNNTAHTLVVGGEFGYRFGRNQKSTTEASFSGFDTQNSIAKSTVESTTADKCSVLGSDHVVKFSHDSSRISESDNNIIDHLAECIQKDMLVEVDGYASMPGTRNYNKKISLKRAKAVKEKLSNDGVETSKIAVKGHGVELAQDTSNENRLVRIRVIS